MKILKDECNHIVIERDDKSIVEVGLNYVNTKADGREVVTDFAGLSVLTKNPRRFRSMDWGDFDAMNEALYKIFGRNKNHSKQE